MKLPKWLRTEKSSALRKILAVSIDEKLKEAARQILFSRGESTVLSEEDAAKEEESMALRLCNEQVELVKKLRFRRCKLATATGYEKSGTIITIRPVYNLEKNYAHIRTDDGDTYIRSIDALDLLILEEYDEKRLSLLGNEGDLVQQDIIDKATFKQSKALREAHEGLEKIGMLVQLKDSVGLDVLGRVSGIGIAKEGAYFRIYYSSPTEGRRMLRKSVKKAIATYEFFADSETERHNADGVKRWRRIFEQYEGDDCEF
jgi:phosphoglycolate phosphatase-like HAD superfamily hydrolase